MSVGVYQRWKRESDPLQEARCVRTASVHCSGAPVLKPRIVSTRETILQVQSMLQLNVSERLGCLKGGLKDLKRHKWFAEIDWNKLANKETKVSRLAHLPFRLWRRTRSPCRSLRPPFVVGFVAGTMESGAEE